MASKINKMALNNNNSNNKRIKFLAVSLDGKNEDIAALKDMLQVLRVPQGIIHHPTQGLFGQKVDLDRSNLTTLKKQLERYVEEDDVREMEIVLNEMKGGDGAS